MKRKFVAFVLCLVMLSGLPSAAAAGKAELQQESADRLHTLGLFQGVGTKADGTPEYALDRALSRQEAVTMLVRLLGKEQEALADPLPHPFADVDAWAAPYVGYAYDNGLTNGISATTFGGAQPVTAAQYLTFVLRALGYVSGVDFEWDAAWEMTDVIGMTNGEYGAENNGEFLRGDAVFVSENVLSANKKDGSTTLLEQLIADGAVGEQSETSSMADDAYMDFAREIIMDGKRPVTVSLDEDDMMGRTALLPYFEEYDGFAGSGETLENALQQALTGYLKVCLDGDYSDGYIGTPSFRSWNNAVDAFLLTDTKGTIVAYGVRTYKTQKDFTLYFCDLDSRDFMDAQVETVMEMVDRVKKLPCEAWREGDRYVYYFPELPEEAVWFESGLYGSRSATSKKGYDIERQLYTRWSSIQAGQRPEKAVQEIYTCDAFYTEYKGTAYQLFFFMNEKYELIAYSIGEIEIN